MSVADRQMREPSTASLLKELQRKEVIAKQQLAELRLLREGIVLQRERDEKAMLLGQNKKLLRELEKTQEERDELKKNTQQELDRLRTRHDKMKSEFAEFESRLEKTTKEERRVRLQRDDLCKQKKAITEELNMVLQEKTDLQETAKLVDVMSAENRRMQSEVSQLREENAALKRQVIEMPRELQCEITAQRERITKSEQFAQELDMRCGQLLENNERLEQELADAKRRKRKLSDSFNLISPMISPVQMKMNDECKKASCSRDPRLNRPVKKENNQLHGHAAVPGAARDQYSSRASKSWEEDDEWEMPLPPMPREESPDIERLDEGRLQLAKQEAEQQMRAVQEQHQQALRDHIRSFHGWYPRLEGKCKIDRSDWADEEYNKTAKGVMAELTNLAKKEDPKMDAFVQQLYRWLGNVYSLLGRRTNVFIEERKAIEESEKKRIAEENDRRKEEEKWREEMKAQLRNEKKKLNGVKNWAEKIEKDRDSWKEKAKVTEDKLREREEKLADCQKELDELRKQFKTASEEHKEELDRCRLEVEQASSAMKEQVENLGEQLAEMSLQNAALTVELNNEKAKLTETTSELEKTRQQEEACEERLREAYVVIKEYNAHSHAREGEQRSQGERAEEEGNLPVAPSTIPDPSLSSQPYEKVVENRWRKQNAMLQDKLSNMENDNRQLRNCLVVKDARIAEVSMACIIYCLCLQLQHFVQSQQQQIAFRDAFFQQRMQPMQNPGAPPTGGMYTIPHFPPGPVLPLHPAFHRGPPQ